jgi:ribonuclease D
VERGALYAHQPGRAGQPRAVGQRNSFPRQNADGLVEKAQALPEEALPEPLQNLIDMPGYRKAFKDIKALVQEVSAEKGVSAELLASSRQINQLLNWHWQLKTATGSLN